MNKSLVFAFVVLVVAGVFLWEYIPRTTPPTYLPDTATLVTENATTTYTEIKLSYPKSSETYHPEIFQLVQGVRSEFLQEYGSPTPQDIADMNLKDNYPYQLYINTRIATSSKTISYILEIYQFTGGAHGGTGVHTFTYDVNDKLVTLDKVFTSDYLPVLSRLSRDYFYRTLGESSQPFMIDSGTEAKALNFSSWYLGDEDITFILGQYQVGPYALGIQEFTEKITNKRYFEARV